MPTTTSDAGNRIVPNSHNFPNLFSDHLMYLLDGEEWKVLSLAVREILGWQENIAGRKDRISLSQFKGGKVSKKTGRVVSRGTGLSRSAILRALEALAQFKILVPVGEPTQDGQEYYLQEDEQAIDWAALEARAKQRASASGARTSQGRAVLAGKKGGGGLSDRPPDMAVMGEDKSSKAVCGTDRRWSVPQTAGGLSDRHTENQSKTNSKTRFGADAPNLPDWVYSGEVKNGRRLVDPVKYQLYATQQNARRNGGQVVDVSDFPDSLAEFARVFILTSGYTPIKKSDRKYWTQTFSEAAHAGATPEMFRLAVIEHQQEGMPMDSPESVLYIVRRLLAEQAKPNPSPTPKPVNLTDQRLAAQKG